MATRTRPCSSMWAGRSSGSSPGSCSVRWSASRSATPWASTAGSGGWFDPIVEFMRPVPPLALIPLVIIWAGIGELGKIILLFLAALWIMAIAARSGVSGVAISKVHAAYSLGATRYQIMRRVIIPNSLPELFTGARVAMGVCWGTVVAAELVAAERGAGMMIMVASRFQLTDIVIMGIILIGIIGIRHRHPDARDRAVADPVEGPWLRVRCPPKATLFSNCR